MPNEESGTVEAVETPKAGEETQVLEEEELTRIVGGAGEDGSSSSSLYGYFGGARLGLGRLSPVRVALLDDSAS